MNTVLLLGEKSPTTYSCSMMHELSECLEKIGYEVLFAKSDDDVLHIVKMNQRVCAVVYDLLSWTIDLANQVSELNEFIPIFAMVDTKESISISLEQTGYNLSFFEYRLKTGKDLAKRIDIKVKNYKSKITPPFTTALMKYVEEKKYPFCTPGHLGGSAFLKSPIGTIFYDFYGPNLFQSDVSVSMTELGSLLDHSGPHKEAEELIAKTFGSDSSYIVTNGTSTANKMVGMFCAIDGDTVLIDRNCHKSLTHLLMMLDVEPIYLRPKRNAYGILGGIPKSEFTKDNISEKVATRQLKGTPKYMVVTNSTYDGIFYNVEWIKEQKILPYMHFDSAWVPYTAFNSIYDGKRGIGGKPPADGQIIFETQSTHKLLAAFSQTSMIHVKGDLDKNAFNESYMMHTSTSPQYNMVASAEVAAAMMQDKVGLRLVEDSINRALLFRREIKRLNAESDDWYFDVWQPDDISGPNECWTLKPDETWHGFKDQDDDYNYLDPIKVTILTPGIDKNGVILDEGGIPASIVSAYLDEAGIVVEKTGPYNMLFLFSIGVDEPKSLSLLHELTAFKRDFDANLTIEEMLPKVYQESPEFYKGMTIQELASGIHNLMVNKNLPEVMYHAFDVLPEIVLSPHKTYQTVITGQYEEIYIEDLMNRVSSDMILPYPPGVPLVMPGEMITPESKTILDFLLMLVEIGEQYPGFETDIHGAYRQDDGRYKVRVLADSAWK